MRQSGHSPYDVIYQAELIYVLDDHATEKKRIAGQVDIVKRDIEQKLSPVQVLRT